MNTKTIVCWMSDGVFDHLALPDGINLVYIDFDELEHFIKYEGHEYKLVTAENDGQFSLSLIIDDRDEYFWDFSDEKTLNFVKEEIELLLQKRMTKDENGVYREV